MEENGKGKLVRLIFGEKGNVKALESGDKVRINSGTWNDFRAKNTFFIKPSESFLVPKNLRGEEFANFQKFVANSIWEIVGSVNSASEVRYVGPDIGAKEDPNWKDKSFFVYNQYLEKI